MADGSPEESTPNGAAQPIAPQPETTPDSPSNLWTRDFILIALINLATFVGFNITTTGMPVYLSTLGGPDYLVGLVTTLVTVAALFVRVFAGIVLDRFDRKGVLVFGLAIMALVTVAYAVFPLVGVILALRAAHGIGWGLSSTATSTIAADAIPRKRFAEGIGYFAMTSSLAVAFAPALAIALLQKSGIIPMIALSAGSTLVAIILSLFQRPKKAARTGGNRTLKVSDFFDRRALLPAVLMLLINLAFATIVTFIAIHGAAQGVDDIYLYFIVYAIVTIISRPLLGKVIDRTGYFFPGIVATIGVTVTLLIISISDNILLFCLAGVFGGLGIGTGMGTLQSMAVAAVPPEQRGVATSTFLFGLDAGIAIGAIVAGLLTNSFGYSTMFMIMAIFPLIACAIFLIMGKKRIARYSQN